VATIQRFVILAFNGDKVSVIGTDGQKPFTQNAAESKLKLLQKARPEQRFELGEIDTIWEAL
jgi:hypothetical protein